MVRALTIRVRREYIRLRARLQRGFTLVELMIVVAIVGILAAVATAQYDIYTGKSQLTEAMLISDGRRTEIAEIIGNFGISTAAGLAGVTPPMAGLSPDVAANAGKYVESLVIVDGAITATMKAAGIAACVGGATLMLTPVPPASTTDPVKWNCSTNAQCRPPTCP